MLSARSMSCFVKASNAVCNAFSLKSQSLGFPVSLRLVDVDTQLYNITPGMTCVATVITPESDRRAVLLPLTAIYAPIEGGEYVWVVGDDDRVYRRRVEIGLFLNDPSLYQNLNATSINAASLLNDLKENHKKYVHFSIFGRKEKTKE